MSLFHDTDDERPDHFMRDDDAAPTVGASSAAAPDPDDPFAPVQQPAAGPGSNKPRRRHRFRRTLVVGGIAVFGALAACCYIRYFRPYATEAITTGYVRSVERRGIIFPTYEGELLTHENLVDTVRVYQRDFRFSIKSDSLARLIQCYQGTGRPVTLTFERYYAPLPWRGSSTNIVTAMRPF